MINAIKKKLFHLFYFLGVDLRKILALFTFPRYFFHVFLWIKNGGEISKIYPQLTDITTESGNAKGHYFHQDLLIAQRIYINKPKKHIDIGSRIDGFVAHVASFREIIVLDTRPLKIKSHKNIKFIKQNLLNNLQKNITADSVSCLHALEHFGMGRYGDEINVDGHIIGLKHIHKILKKNGILYISIPISNKSRVEFNAHRIFSPDDFVSLLNIGVSYKLLRFDYVDDFGDLHLNKKIHSRLKNISYGCGILMLQKI